MDWNIAWVLWAVIAVLIAAINLIRAFLGKKRGTSVLVLCSLSFGAFSALAEVKMLIQWVEHGEMTILNQAMSSIPNALIAELIVLIILNGIAIIVGNRTKR